MRLDKTDLGRSNSSVLACFAHKSRLSLCTGKRDAIGVPVLIRGCSNDYCMDQITILDGFGESQEYFETLVERPTRQLLLRVIFPKTRPPKNASLVVEEADSLHRNLSLRLMNDGRPFVSMMIKHPELFRTYSLRWSW